MHCNKAYRRNQIDPFEEKTKILCVTQIKVTIKNIFIPNGSYNQIHNREVFMEALFKPIKINDLIVPNRIAMAPMTRSMSPDGIPTDTNLEYYKRRAAAEVGMIITEGVEVSHPASSGYPNVPNLREASHNGWKNLISAVQNEGSTIFCQLWHVGGIRKPGQPPNPEVPGYTPSGLVKKDKKVAYEMTENDVEDLIQNYVKDIEIIKALGFDGVELHGAHGYMIDQFFWKDTNIRKDQFGKESDLRTKFVCEIVSRARKLVGKNYPIMLRFSQWKQQDYEARLASSPKDLETFLGPISDAGVDMFHASTRRYWEPEFDGSDLNLAGWTKKITNKPTITVGSVGLDSDFIGLYVGKDQANTSPINKLIEMFDRDEFDMVAVGRALLSDPEWVLKVKEGKEDQIIGFTKEYVEKYF